MNNLKRFFEPVKQHKRYYCRTIIESFIIFGFDIYAIIILQYITKAIEQKNIDLIIQYITIFAVSYCIFSILKWYTRDHSWVLLGNLNEKSIYEKYYKQLLLADNTKVEKIGTGRLMAILNQGVSTRKSSLEGAARFIPEIIASIGFAVYVLCKFHWGLGVIFALIIICVSLFVNYINFFAIKSRNAGKESEVSLSRHNVRLIMSKQEILQSNKMETEIIKYSQEIDNKYRFASITNRFIRWMYEVPIWVSQLLLIFIVAYVITSIKGGYFDYSLFVGLIGARGHVSKSIIKFTGRFKEFSRDFVHIEKLRHTFDELPLIHGYDDGKPFRYERGNISLKNIRFSYENGSEVFSRFSIHINGGTKTALVGPSGGGKSTLIKFIAGYIRPDEGSILIDNQNLSDISLQSYYQHIGYLTQEPSVFDGTIRENLFYATMTTKNGVLDIEHGALDVAIQAAQCQFIYELPKGLDTEIGERGVRLSGGQKQRLAIAKIMLKNPEIILLDEPTSALDSYNEELVTHALDNLFKHKTVIIVAHRLQTVKHADDIVFINNGKVIERGNHKELLALKGEYYKMVELQSGF